MKQRILCATALDLPPTTGGLGMFWWASVMDLKKLLILFKSMLLRQLISELKMQGLAFASLTDVIPLFDNQDGGSRL